MADGAGILETGGLSNEFYTVTWLLRERMGSNSCLQSTGLYIPGYFILWPHQGSKKPYSSTAQGIIRPTPSPGSGPGSGPVSGPG